VPTPVRPRAELRDCDAVAFSCSQELTRIAHANSADLLKVLAKRRFAVLSFLGCIQPSRKGGTLAVRTNRHYELSFWSFRHSCGGLLPVLLHASPI